MYEKLSWLKFALQVENQTESEPQPNDNETAKTMAEWSLLEFISAQVKKPKRTIRAQRFFTTTSVSEMMETKATILRIEGSITHRPQDHFWFIAVPLRSRVHFFSVNTRGEAMSLDPRIEGYPITPTRVVSGRDVTAKFPIDRTLDFILDRKFDEVYTGAEQIDVMFGGKLDPVSQVKRRKTLPTLEGATI
jgi:hypothetical protein